MPKKQPDRRMPSRPRKAKKAARTSTKTTGKIQPPKPPGRPSAYSPSLGLRICAEIATSNKSLRRICDNPGMPSPSMVFRWLQTDVEFREQYARAREAQAELLVEELIEIADDGRNDTYLDAEGKEHVATDVIQRSKLRVDTRKWVAMKLLPKKYGDKLEVDATVRENLTLEELEQRVKEARA